MVRFLLLQLIAHTISDFYLQTSKSCADKAKNGFKSLKLYIHALITFVLLHAFEHTRRLSCL